MRDKTFLSENLESQILYEPADLSVLGCNSLYIVTGFTDCDMISQHLLNLLDGANGKDPIYPRHMQINIILGMYKGLNISASKHQKIKRTILRLQTIKQIPQISCRYIVRGKEVHSKVYAWLKGNEPEKGYVGSANYTINAFRRRRECMVACDPYDALEYYHSLLPDTMDCFDTEIEHSLRMHGYQGKTELDLDEFNLENITYDKVKDRKPIDTLTVSLLKANGEVGYGSGINWGIRPNGYKRDRNQAYIPYNKSDKKDGFFPKRIHPEDKSCPLFKVVTKDEGVFYMRVAQQGDKALHSAEDNSIIGRLIRNRIGVPDGTFVTLDMLKKYGRTDVAFKKLSDDVYILEF